MKTLLAVMILCQSLLWPPVLAQIDGSFWWMNTALIQKAEQYRNEKDVKANVVNNETEIDSIRVAGNGYSDDSDDSPDCICVPSHLCRTTLPEGQQRDSLCGSNQICCRKRLIISQHHPAALSPHSHPKPLIPSSLHAPDETQHSNRTINQVELPIQPSAPNLSLLLEISSLLQEFNSHDNAFEPDAEFIFNVTPREMITIAPPTILTTTPFKPIAFNEPYPTPQTITTPRTIPSTSQQSFKPKKCGQRRAAISSRIHFFDEDESMEEIYTGNVNFGEYPWTVYLEERIKNGSFLYKCGGALVTSNAVVTAGHCIANARNHPEDFQIIAGDWDRRHHHERLPSQKSSIQRIILHPDYYSGSLLNDIAVLILSSPMNDSLANVGNVCLPSPGSDFIGSNCILSGWGASPSKPNEEEPIQRFVATPIVTITDCEKRLQENSALGRRFKIHDSFLCAGGIVGVDSCKGSGGSPLVCQRNGAYMLAGIMSWGVSCGKGDPVVFANVAHQVSWLDSVINSLDDNVVYFV